jgi:O-antigen ligase
MALLLGILLSTGIFIRYGSSYMVQRMFSKEAFLDTKRIERWQVSFEIFREHPFIGVGFERIKPMREEKYLENNYSTAAASEYNAHNQFLEYLSTSGAIGGFIYAAMILFLLLLSAYRKDTLFGFIFLAFILSNITESMMVRIKGIEYFAIFATLFLCGTVNGKQQSNEYLYNTRLRAIFRTGKWIP